MGTLGDFVGGFQGGYDFMSKARRDRQIEKAIDYELSDWESKREGRDKEREASGLGALEESGYKDPFLMRLMNWRPGKDKAVDPAAPAQSPMQSQAPAASTAAPGGSFMPQQQQGAFGAPPQQPGMYREGGPVDEETANRYELYRAVTMADGGRAIPLSVQPVVLADGGMPKRLTEEAKKQAKIEKQRLKTEKKSAKPESKGKGGGRKGFGKGKFVKGLGLVAAGSAAIDTYGTPTEDYYERFGMTPSAETNLGQFGQDLGVRALGYASDLGSTLTGGYADRLYRDKQRQAGERALPADEPAPQAPAQAPAQGPSRVAAQPAPRQAPAAAPAPTPPPEQQQFDWSSVQVSPDEIPSVPTKDWVEYRKQMIDALTMQGMSVREAHDEVTAIQQGGFMRESQAALTFLQMGDSQSASRAMKAAYQYFPNGADVKFGMTKDEAGQPALIAMGTDEKTGENKGQPMLLNSERLATMMQNFSDPKAFTAWTKDWRDEAFKDKKYEEIDKPTAQSQADLRAEQGEYMRNRGAAALIDAGRPEGGLKESDYRGSEAMFLDEIMMAPDVEPEDRHVLASLMAQIKTRYPNLRNTTILETVLRGYEEGANPDEIVGLFNQP